MSKNFNAECKTFNRWSHAHTEIEQAGKTNEKTTSNVAVSFLCLCLYDSTVRRPCEGASGQRNLISSPSADCSILLYLQHMWAYRTMSVQASSFVLVHLLKSACFWRSLQIAVKSLVFQENWFFLLSQTVSCQEMANVCRRLHICNFNYVKFINTASLIKHKQLTSFQVVWDSHADIMLYSMRQQTPAQWVDLYISINPTGLICESGALPWFYK